MDHLFSPEAERVLERALLSADPETLTETQRERRDALEAARRRPPPRRPSTAEAAERALALLPASLAAAIATDRRLRESEAALLALLCRRARAQGGVHCAPSVPELAARLGCAERTVQLAARALARHGLIAVEQRVLRPGHNETNVYAIVCPGLARLLENAPRRTATRLAGPQVRAAGQAPAGAADGANRGESGGESHRTLKKNLNTNTLIPDSHRVTSQDPAQCKPARQASWPGPATRPLPPPPALPSSGPLHALGLRALDHVAPALAAKARDPDDPVCVWSGWERLLPDKIPDFSPRLWRRALQVHGPRAFLALAETLLKDQAGQVETRGGYLWGILKHGIAAGTRRGECQPGISVAEILDERAEGPETTKAALSVALTAALAERPKAEQIRYLRRAGPDQRRRAGRLARRGDAAGFAAEIARVAGREAEPPGPRGALAAEVYDTVRRIAAGCDVAALETEWRSWCARQGLIPARPEAHFVAFAKSWEARRRR